MFPVSSARRIPRSCLHAEAPPLPRLASPAPARPQLKIVEFLGDQIYQDYPPHPEYREFLLPRSREIRASFHSPEPSPQLRGLWRGSSPCAPCDEGARFEHFKLVSEILNIACNPCSWRPRTRVINFLQFAWNHKYLGFKPKPQNKARSCPGIIVMVTHPRTTFYLGSLCYQRGRTLRRQLGATIDACVGATLTLLTALGRYWGSGNQGA